MRVLVVEDNPDLAEVLRMGLVEEGYAVDLSLDGEDGLWRATTVEYDLVVLDLMLPEVDGLTILRRMRADGKETPILILTARDATDDRVRGLDTGADDYLVKPFEWDELYARLRALLRRGPAGSDGVLRYRDLELDFSRREVRRDGEEIKLTAKEFQVLHVLMREPERVFSRTEIIEHVYDDDYDGMSNVIDVFFSRLRKKLGKPGEPPVIRTVRGVGYALRGDGIPEGRRKRVAFETTLLLGLLILNFVVISGMTVVVYARSHRLAHESMRSDLRIRAKTLSGVMEIEEGKIEFEIPPEAVFEYETPGSGAYAVICDVEGEPVIRSPSLGEHELSVNAPWRDGEFVFEEIDDGPDGIPCATVTLSFVARADPVEEENEPDWVPPPEEERRYRIRVALDRRERDRHLAHLALFLALIAGGALAATVLGGLLLARRVLRPIRRMTAEAERLTPQDTSRRLGPDTVVRELHSFATTLNSALDRQAEALERQRRFTSDAGHELRTPVSVLLGNSDLLLRRPRSAEEYREGLERQHRTALRMRDITENLLTLARADSDRTGLRDEIVSAGEVVATLCEEFRLLGKQHDVRIRCDVDPDLRVRGDAGYLGQLVQNLLSNAVKFTPKDGRVDVRLVADNGSAVLTVSDTGPGIPPEQRERIFDRFYRVQEGKDRMEGAGLGLSIAAWIVKAHGGKVLVKDADGGGALFEVRLPVESGIDSPVRETPR